MGLHALSTRIGERRTEWLRELKPYDVLSVLEMPPRELMNRSMNRCDEKTALMETPELDAQMRHEEEQEELANDSRVQRTCTSE